MVYIAKDQQKLDKNPAITGNGSRVIMKKNLLLIQVMKTNIYFNFDKNRFPPCYFLYFEFFLKT